MLRTQLIHPPLLEALAACGHGSKVLLADGNYPALTARGPRARLVHLNLAPGLLSVRQVLEVLLTAVNVESAEVMATPAGVSAPIQDDYHRRLGPDVPVNGLERFAFYEAVRAPEVGLVVATGEQEIYANLLLTIGLR